jgi:negative regulator of sigma E activity
MTRAWSDEQISAFLDGELVPAEMDALAKDVEADADLAKRVERLGAANTAFVQAVSAIDKRPMSAGIEKLLAEPPAEQTGAKVLPFRKRSVGAWVMEHRALAASLLCAAIVGGIASGLREETDPFAPKADGVILASSPLHNALEAASTDQAVLISAGVSATPRLTFASDTGAWCRQFDVASQKGVTTAIACREGKTWRTQVAVFGKSRGADYQIADAGKSPMLEAFIDKHMPGAALNAEQEKQAIKAGWEKGK